MPVTDYLQSLPQCAYQATQVLAEEEYVATTQGISLSALMERAGQAFFSYLQEQCPDAQQLFIVAGKGNNGGDGFVVARLAHEQGIQVTVYFCGETSQLKGDALAAFEQLASTHVTIIYQSELTLKNEFFTENHYDLIVDALFGIGFKGALQAPYIELVELLNHSGVPIMSVDVPSGLNASTGGVSTVAIKAWQTVTFIVLKQGLLTGQAAKHVGHLKLASLTLNDPFNELIDGNVFIQGNATLPPKPARDEVSHKGDIGLLLTVGGQKGMPGAIRLASEAALRSGAALVAVSCHQENHSLVLTGRPELMLAPDNATQLADSLFFEKAKVIILGPGLGQSQWSESLFKQVVASPKPMVVDADGLNILSRNPVKKDNWVLTPHPGEAAKLLGITVAEVESDRFAACKAIVEQYGGICVLKGAGSLMYDGKETWINTSGNSGMASGGMGDVLSGIIAAMLMQVTSPFDAVRLAVYFHGKAADIIARQQGKIGMLASDLFPEVQRLLNEKI